MGLGDGGGRFFSGSGCASDSSESGFSCSESGSSCVSFLFFCCLGVDDARFRFLVATTRFDLTVFLRLGMGNQEIVTANFSRRTVSE